MTERYPHDCVQCAWHWVSRDPNPKTCANPECRSRRWDGREKKKTGPKKKEKES